MVWWLAPLLHWKRVLGLNLLSRWDVLCVWVGFLFRQSGFIPQCSDMHISLTADSKLSVGVSGCLGI